MTTPRGENDAENQSRMKPDRRISPRSTARLLTLGGLLVAACGGSALDSTFESGWQVEDGAEQRAVLRALEGKRGMDRVPAAVGVTGRSLVGRALPDGKLWKYESAVDVLPSLAGDAVAFTTNGTLVVLDVKSGAKLFSVDVAGRRLEGMGTDGAAFAFLLVDSDDARPDLVLATDRRGRTLTSATTSERVGTPAVVGGIALVPWSRQYVSAVDLTSGEPLGRLLVRDAVHTVSADAAGTWILGKGAVRLAARLAETMGEGSLTLGAPELPGEPAWPVDGSKPRPARARPVALVARPVHESGQDHFAGDAYAFAYYDLVVGYDAGTARVRWVNSFTRSVSGADASDTGVTVCLEDGTLFHLGYEDGLLAPAGALESRLRACVVSGIELPPGNGKRPALEEQIRAAVVGTGPDMARVQLLLVEELGRRKSPEATAALLAIAQDPLTSPAIADRAGELLRSKTEGADAMLEALALAAPIAESDGGVGGDGAAPPAEELRGRRAPPIGPLAEALTRAGDKRAAPVLARYLAHPAVAGAQSLALVHAIQILGGPAEAPDVRDFYATYKNTGGDPEFIAALGIAAQFLLTHGNQDDRALVAASLEDSLTHPALKAQLEFLDLAKADAAPPVTKAPVPAGRQPSPRPGEASGGSGSPQTTAPAKGKGR